MYVYIYIYIYTPHREVYMHYLLWKARKPAAAGTSSFQAECLRCRFEAKSVWFIGLCLGGSDLDKCKGRLGDSVVKLQQRKYPCFKLLFSQVAVSRSSAQEALLVP